MNNFVKQNLNRKDVNNSESQAMEDILDEIDWDIRCIAWVERFIDKAAE